MCRRDSCYGSRTNTLFVPKSQIRVRWKWRTGKMKDRFLGDGLYFACADSEDFIVLIWQNTAVQTDKRTDVFAIAETALLLNRLCWSPVKMENHVNCRPTVDNKLSFLRMKQWRSQKCELVVSLPFAISSSSFSFPSIFSAPYPSPFFSFFSFSPTLPPLEVRPLNSSWGLGSAVSSSGV